MRLVGRRVVIRDMVREDLDRMEEWAPFEDPLYALWDVQLPHTIGGDIWFTSYANDPSRRLYAIEDRSGQLIGRMSLREIEGHTSARLGIGFGAQWVGQGYGTDAIKTFLPHFFETLGFRTLYLDVAAPNRRAVCCYEHCGFQRIGMCYRDIGFDAHLDFLSDDHYRDVRRFFRRRGNVNEVLFYEMKLDRADWIKHHQRKD